MRSIQLLSSNIGSAQDEGHANNEPSILQDMKLQDMKGKQVTVLSTHKTVCSWVLDFAVVLYSLLRQRFNSNCDHRCPSHKNDAREL